MSNIDKMNRYRHYENRPGIEVVFSNGENTLSIFYIIYEWSAAQTFYEMIKESIDNGIEICGDTSFNITLTDKNKLIEDINESIIGINKKYNTTMPLFESDPDLNFLHQQAAIYAECDLWSTINDRIHAYEQYIAQQDSEPRVNAYFKFKTNDYVLLDKEDFLFFKTDREYGDLCLNYTYKGKHWLEIQSDNDLEALIDGQLKPETRISPTGYMLFRPPSPSPFFRLHRFVKWFKENLPDREITTDMALGYLLIGKLVMPSGWNDLYVPERSQWTRMLCEYKKIVDVKITTIRNVNSLLKISKMIQENN